MQRSSSEDYHPSPPKKTAVCSCCGLRAQGRYDKETKLARDVDVGGQRIYVKFERWRVLCPHCKAVFVEKLDRLADNPRYTERFALQSEFRCHARPEGQDCIRPSGWARAFFKRWKEGLKWQRLAPYKRFAAMIERHWYGIASYCHPENKVSLGFVEAVNNKIRVLQRSTYGLRDDEYLELKVITSFLPPL